MQEPMERIRDDRETEPIRQKEWRRAKQRACASDDFGIARTLAPPGSSRAACGIFSPRPEPFASEPAGQVPLFPSGAVRLAVVVAAQDWLGKDTSNYTVEVGA